MRKLVSLQQAIDHAQEDNIDPRDLVIDEDDICSLEEVDDDLEENPDDEE